MIISNILGRWAETLACKYLKKHKYKILERNYKSRFGEIDIIALKDCILVFVEVKYRSLNNFGFPRDYVTPSKLQKIKIAIRCYLKQKQLFDYKCRFDVIEIYQDNIEHIQNIEI